MTFLIVVLLILGTPFLIGFGIGRATKSSEPDVRNPNLDAIWRSGYAAGIEYERRSHGRQWDSPPYQHNTEARQKTEAGPHPAEQHRSASPEPPPPPKFPPAAAFSSPTQAAPTSRPVPYTSPTNQQWSTTTTPPPISPQAAHTPTPPTSAAEKRRRTDRNINITLYSATLLIITASALFISAAVPTGVIIGGLLTATIAFYVAGLWLHAAVPRLRPAAVAFVGTSVALVPINGLTWWLQSDIAGAVIWLLASLLGLVMLIVATVRLQSTLGIYLTMPLVVSSAISAGASLQRGYTWALIFAIVLSLAMTWLLRLAETRVSEHRASQDGSLVQRYIRAIHQTNLILVPLVIVASWLMPAVLTSRDYFALYIVATIYFVHAVYVGDRRYQGLHISASGVMGFITMLSAVTAFNIPGATALILLGIYAAAAALGVYALQHFVRRADRPTHGWGSGPLVGITAAYITGCFIGGLYHVTQNPDPPGTWNIPWVAFILVTLVIVLHSLRQEHSLRTRMLLLTFMPAVLLPAYLIYSWSAFASILTTLVIGVVLAVQYRWTPSQRSTPVQPDKYWSLHALALVVITFATQLVHHFDGSLQSITLVVTLLGFAWATAALRHKADLAPSQDTPRFIWTVVTAAVTIFNVTVGISASLADPKTIAMYLVFGLGILLTMVVAARRMTLDTTAQPTAITLAATASVVQLVAFALWSRPATEWITIVALLVLAGWFIFLSGVEALASQNLVRLSFVVAGQLTVMTAGTLFVIELGGNGSLQRLVTALIATAGTFVLTWRSRQKFSGRQLAGHRGLVMLILASITVAELSLGQDRLITVILLAAFVAVAVLLGTSFGGGWFITPAIWFAAWNFSDYPRVFNGWINSPLYSGSTLVWSTLGAAFVVFVVMSWQRHRLFDARSHNAHQRLQILSSLVVLIVIGYGHSIQLQPINNRLILGALFLSLVAAGFYLAGRFLRRNDLIAGVFASMLIVSGYVYGLFAHNLAMNDWFVTRSVTWSLCFAALLVLAALVDYNVQQRAHTSGLRTVETGELREHPSGLIPHRLFLQTGVMTVLITALLAVATFWIDQAPVSGIDATQAVTTGAIAIITAWTLAVEFSRDRTFIHDYRFSTAMKWSAQTAAVMITLSVSAIVWWITTYHRDPSQARYWLFLVLSVAMGLWALRFMFNNNDHQQAWRNATWIAAAVLFTGNTLTLLATGTALMQLSGLIGFAGILTLGLIFNYRVLSIWGAVGITAAVLWYLRDLTYVWIGLLGISLLAAAIWQLRRTTAANKNARHMSDPYPRTKAYEPPPPPPPTD